MTKWLGGIIASIITAVALWFLIGPDGLITKKPPKLTPRVEIQLLESKIIAPNINTSFGERFSGWVTIHNSGDKFASNCSVWMLGGGSERFGLQPGAKRNVNILTARLYSKKGRYKITVTIKCDSGYSKVLISDTWAL